jgi:hypothetical protein
MPDGVETRDITAAEKEELWRLDCAVPKGTSERVQGGNMSQLRLRNVRSPEYVVLRECAVGLLCAGVGTDVLAKELGMSRATMRAWAKAGLRNEERS